MEETIQALKNIYVTLENLNIQATNTNMRTLTGVFFEIERLVDKLQSENSAD